MTIHLLRELNKLKKQIVSLGGLAEENLKEAIKAFEERNVAMAKVIIESDVSLDQKEMEIEEECLKMLALYQPVANDLRLIVAILKINNDLERIGDLAVNISKRAIDLNKLSVPFIINNDIDFGPIAGNVMTMLKNSLDALINIDEELAEKVCAADDIVDEQAVRLFAMLRDEMKNKPEFIDALLPFMMVTKHLERIADLATNIAEDTIYMINGDIVRHGRLAD